MFDTRVLLFKLLALEAGVALAVAAVVGLIWILA